MKKTILFLLIAAVALATGCTHKWDTAYAKQKCMERNKGSMMGEAGIEKLCDCMAQKEVIKYKSEEERNKDVSGTDALITECQLEIIKK